MYKRRMTGWAVLLLWSCSVMGCGYRFPAERNAITRDHWSQTYLTVEGGQSILRSDGILTRVLDELLTTRLGPFATTPPSKDQRHLRVRLDAVDYALILEDKSGRANQYRVTVTAQPTLEVDGKPLTPGYPSVKGATTYYEPSSGTASQAARSRAATEAMNQLADNLAALLAGDFTPSQSIKQQ
ncbi:MAG: LPS assembly lipoprotein LptE [Magnetococcus sp. YQC-5]